MKHDRLLNVPIGQVAASLGCLEIPECILHRLREDAAFASQASRLWIKLNGSMEPPSHARGRALMEGSFFGMKEWTEHFGLDFGKTELPKFPWSDKFLSSPDPLDATREIRETHLAIMPPLTFSPIPTIRRFLEKCPIQSLVPPGTEWNGLLHNMDLPERWLLIRRPDAYLQFPGETTSLPNGFEQAYLVEEVVSQALASLLPGLAPEASLPRITCDADWLRSGPGYSLTFCQWKGRILQIEGKKDWQTRYDGLIVYALGPCAKRTRMSVLARLP